MEAEQAKFFSTSQGRAGKHSAAITNEGGERALLQSSRIPVVPGEKLSASVWVRGKDFAAGRGGSAVFTLACLDSAGRYFNWFRFGEKNVGATWRQLHGQMVAPERTAFVVMQLGHNHSSGTLFFDDASLEAEREMVIRLGVREEMRPGKATISATIINRNHWKGLAKLTVTDGKDEGGELVRLSGAAQQRCTVVVPLASGDRKLTASLTDPAGQVVARSPEVSVRVLSDLEMDPPVPTHFCLEDGQPYLSQRLWVQASAQELRGAKIRLEMRSPLFPETPRAEVEAKPGRVDISLEAPAKTADWELTASLIYPDGRKIVSSQDWHVITRDQARVDLNDTGFPVVGGKPFFPLGTFNSGKYELMKETGFNTVHAWNRARTTGGLHPRHQPTKDFLEDAQKAGMMAVLMLPSSLAQEGDWREYRRRIRMFRNHPALLAWDEEEGVARGEMKPELLEKMVAILREEDPNHPFCLADSYDVIRKVDRRNFFVDRLMDIGMWWYYPIPLENSDVSPLDGQDQPLPTLELRPPIFLAEAQTKKPLWVGLQAYRNKKRPDTRLPNPQEYRAMAYLTLIYGAKGLFYYMGPSAGVVEGEKDPHPWGYLHTLAPELASLENVLTTHPASPPSEMDRSPISSRLWEVGGEYTLITVNRTKSAVSTEITAPYASVVRVKSEDRTLKPTNNVLRDSFEPYGVHIYQWSGKPPAATSD
ncbi:MAG: hypothetical protein IT209_08880 [Armatimonadetes bacterium]|nr:hypothetical protein [Armatimonadota bacterium]